MISKKDMRFLDEARKEAERSTYHHTHIGCVLVYKNHVIGRGHNTEKTDPLQKRANRYRQFKYVTDKAPVHLAHAEISAIKSVPYAVDRETDWSKVTCYTYRISPGQKGSIGLSRPCPGCRKILEAKGVRQFCYTGNGSYVYEKDA